MRLRATALLLSTIVTSSCGGDDAPPASAAGLPFTIWVYDEPLMPDGEAQPIANVRVAFDPPGGGERVTQTTAADGHVTFEGDFAKGGASVTVLSDEHVYVTMLEASPETARVRPNAIGKSPSDLVIFPPRFDRAIEASSVELRGNIFGKRDPNDVVSLAVSSLPRLGAAQALESAYALRAPKDRPFFVLGHEMKSLVDKDGVVVENELLKSFRIELPARSDDQQLDLDLPKLSGLPTRQIQVRAEPPLVDNGPFGPGTRAFSSAGSIDSRISLGLYARTAPTADGRAFDIDVTVVDTDISPETVVSEATLVAPDGSRSTRREQGAMSDGMVWKDFLLPPTVPDPDASRTIRDPIPIDGFPAGADLVARVYAGGNRLLWVLYGPPGGPHAKTFTIPYRDEVGSADIQLFALSISAQADRVALSGRRGYYRFESTFRDIQLRKQ